jgi:uncharacterized membrane protein YccC
MTRLPDEWRRAPPAVRLTGRQSLASWISPWSDQLVEGLRGPALIRWARLWMQWLGHLRRHNAGLGLFFRVTASALLSFELAQCVGLQLPLGAVVSAIIVTQASVGQSLKASLDYLAGTISGAIYGAAIAVLLGGDSEVRLLLGLAIAVGPLALIATVRQSLTVAPITAAVVLLIPTLTHGSPSAAAADRVFEVTLGALIGLTSSFVLFPSSAYALAIEAAARTLEHLAKALGELTAGLKQALDLAALHRIQDGLGEDLIHLNLVSAEAERERTVSVSRAPDTGPLLRTLLRLRHDLVMIGRAAASPFPQSLQARLDPLTDVTATVGDFLRASAAALLDRRLPPCRGQVEKALDAYVTAIDTVRREGVTRGLSSEVTERFFALCFALEQMRHNLRDVHRCVAEWAQSPGQTGDATACPGRAGDPA